MRLLFHVVISILCATPSWALHEAEAGVVDWHKKLIGVPLVDSISTAPVFHRVGEGSTTSVVLAATGNNVLAALNPVNGTIVWRHIFEPRDRIASFHKQKYIVATLSGPGGSTLRSFDVLTGHILIEKRLHSPETGHLSEPDHLGSFIAFTADTNPDMFVLTSGNKIQRIDGLTGEVKWNWMSQDQSSLTIYSKVIVTPTTIYGIGLAKSFASYTLHVTSLSASSGDVIATADIPSSLVDGLEDFIVLSRIADSNVTPRIVWLEQGSLKHIPLIPNLKGRFNFIKGAIYKQIIDVGLSTAGQMIAIRDDGSGRVLKLDSDGSGVKSIWQFQDSATTDRTTASIYAGGFDSIGSPYIVRFHWSHVLAKAAVDVFNSHLADGKGMVTGYTFPFDTNTHGIINHIAIDAANPSGWTVLTRLVVTTTTGAVQLWQQDAVQWTREESLSAIGIAELVELPERVVSLSRVSKNKESFYERVQRQFLDAQDFPQYIVHFIKRFATGSYASISASAAASADPGTLSRDAFGFRQVIVAATYYGKVFGIDSSNGNIIWSRVLGLGWAAEVGGHVRPVKLFVTRTVSDGGNPQVVLVTQRRADNTLVDTVLFHLDAVNGEDVRRVAARNKILEGLDIISGPLVQTFMYQNEVTRAILLLDEFLQVYIYPDTSKNTAAVSLAASSLHFPLRTSTAGQPRIMGHQFALNPLLSSKFVAYPTWTLSLPREEDIQSLIPASRGPVASIGKVLGNRTTLYKYLNPRLFVVLTASHSIDSPTCGVYLVDSAKGSIIYRATLPADAGSCNVKATLTENWLVYHYYDNDVVGIGQAKGYRMVSVELYEGVQVDDKTRSSDMSSFSNITTAVTAFEQSYVFLDGITAVSTTSTKFGITGKDIIVATQNNKIQSIPRRFLNPRRPNRKTTAQEQEEFLIQYDPVLPDDPRRVLSHNYKVANIEHIITAPALLESTSLVFAYGLDLFLTRVAPSGTFDVLSENFNKAQLVLTVGGLALAIVFTKPMVRRKRLRERWYE